MAIFPVDPSIPVVVDIYGTTVTLLTTQAWASDVGLFGLRNLSSTNPLTAYNANQGTTITVQPRSTVLIEYGPTPSFDFVVNATVTLQARLINLTNSAT